MLRYFRFVSIFMTVSQSVIDTIKAVRKKCSESLCAISSKNNLIRTVD